MPSLQILLTFLNEFAEMFRCKAGQQLVFGGGIPLFLRNEICVCTDVEVDSFTTIHKSIVVWSPV